MGAITFNGLLRYQAVDCPVGASAPNCGGSPDAGPGGFTYGDFGDVDGAPEVHSDGEIWLETLWQIRQTLGAAVTESLVTRGMELSPPAPSFLDMRNAIIQADLVNFGGANETALWTVFAQRGMGYFAASDSGDVDPIEDFTAPPDCAVSDCATLSGTVKDKDRKPAAGVQVRSPDWTPVSRPIWPTPPMGGAPSRQRRSTRTRSWDRLRWPVVAAALAVTGPTLNRKVVWTGRR